jgi:uncharacterized membrane protein
MTRSTGSPRDSTRAPQSAVAKLLDTLTRRLERYLRSNVTWDFFFRAVSYLKSALWTVPILAIVLVLVITPGLRAIDAWFAWRISGLGPKGAESLYSTVITLTLSFMVFTFGSLLVAIQVASGQLTPRVIATTLLRDNVVRYTVGLFVFTLVFAVIALDRLETRVLEIVTLITALLGIASIAAFLFLIDYAARLLRPVSILARIGNEGLAMITSMYPEQVGDTADEDSAPPASTDTSHRVVRHIGQAESVLALDVDTLVQLAQRTDGVIEFVPQVGDFVATGEPLFALHGGATVLRDDALHTTVAFGPERTMEQDPLFAFRIMVDVALKALSPAINDPTTAVLAIDQIHRLLRAVGVRRLRDEKTTDAAGRRRVIYRTPTWDDFVHIAFVEIRSCGAGSVQIARRQRAMLDNLIESLPPFRRPALEQERRRLDEAIASLYSIPEDLALARIPDSQGLGSASRTQP